MSLQLICGRAGSGKSSYCFEEIAKTIKNVDNKIYMITPEQFSFTAEKKLLEVLPSKSTIQAEVLTFDRMAYRLLQEVGGATKVQISEAGKAMLISDILLRQKSKLKFLGKTDKNIELVETQITEFKKHGVTVEELYKLEENTQDLYTKTKLNDMITVYEEFEKKIVSQYRNGEDALTTLAEQLEYTNIFDDAYFFIDEFVGFTKQEYNIIEKLLLKAKKISITICADNLDLMTNRDIDVFYSNKHTADKLLYIAKKQDVKLEKTIFLEQTYRFKNQELRHLENNLYKIPYNIYNQKDVQNIKIFLAANPYSEIENVAKQITKLVKEQNYRYKDIAIITKDLDCYAKLCKVILNTYDIPNFIDEKKDLSQNILIKYILALLSIFTKNWSYESVFSYIKTPFMQLEKEEISKFENYCLKWGIKGSKWYYGDWNFEEENEANKDDLEKIKQIRKKVVKPLLKFKENLAGTKTVEQITNELYNFMQENSVPQILMQKKIEQEEIGNLEIAQEYLTAWDTIINIFDEVVSLFKSEKITFEKYIEIIKVGLSSSGLGKIPASQDQVTIGDVDRTRSHKVKAIFIIGLNDGSFPSINKNEGFFNDKDRENFKQYGIELAKTTIEQLYEDNFGIYKACTTAEEKLFLSYPSSKADGSTLRPAMLVTKIKKIFPNIKEESDIVTKQYILLNKKVTFEELIENLRKLSQGEKAEPIWFQVYMYYMQDESWKLKLESSLKAINATNEPESISKENIEKLYGNTLNTTVTRLEQYSSCAFSYFLKYGLRLSEKEQLKIEPVDTGSFMHDVIALFFERIKEQNISIKTIEISKVYEIINQIIDERLALHKNYIFSSNAKYKVLATRLKRVITKSMQYIIESLKNSDFEVYANEVEFKDSKEYKPITLKLDNGKNLEITGKIDRIDLAKINTKNEDESENKNESENANTNENCEKYIRIIDYKSSVKDIDLNEVYAGLQLQLLTYLDATCKIEEVLPAGVLYFSLIDSMIKTKKALTEDEIEEKIRENFKMHGLILADVKVVKMMDKTLESGKSKIIPAYIDKDGNLSRKMSSCVTKEQFVQLQKDTINIIKQIGEQIVSGNISIKPYYNIKNKKTPCKYCKYQAICQFKPGKDNQYRYIGGNNYAI